MLQYFGIMLAYYSVGFMFAALFVLPFVGSKLAHKALSNSVLSE